MKKNLKLAVPLVISAALVIYFLSKLDFKEFTSTLKNSSIPWIFAGQLFFMLQILVRVIRFKYLLGTVPQLQWKMYGLQSTYSILKYLLPGVLGEASILVLFKKFLKIEYSRSSNALFIIRVLDFMLSALLFIVGFSFFFRNYLTGSPLVQYVMGGLIAITIVCLAVIIFIYTRPTLISRLMALRVFNRTRLGGKIRQFILEFLDHFKASLSIKTIAYLTGLSLLVRLFLYLFFVASVQAIRADLGYLEVLFIYLLIWPINVLPIRGPGNLGTHELGWVVALSLLGYGQSYAALIAFGTHTIFVLTLLVILLYLLAVYGSRMFLIVTGSFKTGMEDPGG
jgi:uncharacterized membrane protein YbhN (UPF0104 family)